MRSYSLRGAVASVGFLSAFTVAPSGHAQTRIEGDVQIGPYRIGMTADEVQAAGPTAVKWETEQLRDEVWRLVAQDALSLAGQLFEVVIVPIDEYKRYQLGFHSRTMVDMDTCQENFLAVVAAMEGQFGVFSPSPNFAIPVREGVIAVGQRSTVQVDRDDRNAVWDAVRIAPYPYDGYYANLHAHLNDVRPEIDGCFISVDLGYEPLAVD